MDVSQPVDDECVENENKAVHTQVETLIDEEASNYSDEPSDEDYESEELVSRETLQRLSHHARSTSKYIQIYEMLHYAFIVYLQTVVGTVRCTFYQQDLNVHASQFGTYRSEGNKVWGC